MRRRQLLTAAAVAALAAAELAGAGALPAGAAAGHGRVVTGNGSMTDQVIVTYAPGATYLDDAGASHRGGRGTRALRRFGSHGQVLKLAARRGGADLTRVLTALSGAPGVLSVEPDAVMRPLDVPTDPSFRDQWDLAVPTAAVQGIDAPAAWDLTTGAAGVRVAVIDTGYTDHADLAGRFAVGPTGAVAGYDFVSDSRVGNDGNGRDPDAHDPGDWVTATEAAAGFFAGCPVDDSSWHGTHVSGTIGAGTNNGMGIAGINRVSPIVPVRVLGKCGGFTSDIVDGMRWAAGLAVTGVPANPNPARVLSLSLGGSGACSATYQNAINEITAQGAVVVVAAGNSNANAANFTPASCAGVVTVAATGKAGNRAFYSNFGASVELAAPGGDSTADAGVTILSTLNAGLTTPGADSYGSYQGTSMATPHVSGVVSLMLSRNPALTPAQVTQVLQSSARAFPAGSSCLGTCGAGLLDAAAAVLGADNPPAPTGPGAFGKSSPANGATGRSTTTTLQWAASGGATGYQVCIDTSLNGACTTWTTVTGTSTTARLSRRTTYEWQVRAVNASGQTLANDGTWWRFTTG